MKWFLWCFGILLAFTSAASAGGKTVARDPNPRQATISGSSGPHSFSIYLASEAFQKSRHIINGNKYTPIIDGKQQEYMPEQELSRFNVVVDGKRWPVSSSLWRDCFDPILRLSPDAEHPEAVSSQDGQRLWVKMHGGDGAGAYTVTWHFSANGHNWRTLKYTDTAD